MVGRRINQEQTREQDPNTGVARGRLGQRQQLSWALAERVEFELSPRHMFSPPSTSLLLPSCTIFTHLAVAKLPSPELRSL